MAASIIDDLLDLFPDEMTVEEPTARDGFGKVTAYGTAQIVKIKCTGQHATVRSRGGKLRKSSLRVTVAGSFGLTTDHRYTLPTRYLPEKPVALSVGEATDENGSHHQVVYFS